MDLFCGGLQNTLNANGKLDFPCSQGTSGTSVMSLSDIRMSNNQL